MDDKTATQEIEEWAKNFKKEMKEDIKIWNDLAHKIENEKNYLAILPGEVKKNGTSGHIPFNKKFIGCKVRIFVEKREDTSKV